MISIFRQFSLRFIQARKGRMLATVFGIALGVVMIVATAIVNRSTLASFKRMITTAAGKAELQVLPAAGSGFDDDYLKIIAKTKGVAGAYPAVTGNTRVIKGSKDIDFVLVYGVDTSRDREVRDYSLKTGRFIKKEGREILLTSQWAQDNNVGRGDKLKLLTPEGLKSFKVVGLIADKGAGNTNGGRFAVTNLPSAQEMFTRKGRLDQVDIIVGEEFQKEEVKKSLEKELGANLAVERPTSRGRDVEDSIASYRFMLSLTGSISLLVGLFIIYNNMEISVEERRYSIALMRALGLRRRKIMALVLSEAALLGIIGGALGTLIGIGLAKSMAAMIAGLSTALSRITLTELGITPAILVTGLSAGPLAAVVASLGPAYRMLKVSPLEALSPMETSSKKGGKRTQAAGIVLSFLGLTAVLVFTAPDRFQLGGLSGDQYKTLGTASLGLMMLGAVLLMPSLFKAFLNRLDSHMITLRMALDNLARVPGRTSAAVAGMMIALAMMVALSANADSVQRYTRDWIDTTFGWDMLVSSSFYGTQVDVPLDRAFQTKLRKVRGITSITAFRFTRVDYGGTKAGLSAFDMETMFNYIKFNLLEGNTSKFPQRMKSGKYVALSSTAARKFGLGAGDAIALSTPEGKVRFAIAAVIKDFGQDTGAIYINRPTYQRLWGDERIDGFEFVLKPGYSVTAVKKQIESKLGRNRHLIIRTRDEFKRSVISLVDQSLALTYALVYIAVLVAAIGIMNTALISVWQRKREISTLKALGARKRLVKQILFNEAIVIGFAGALVGVVIGTLMGKAMVEANHSITGIALDFKMPWVSIATSFGLGIGLSAIGSILPGRVASKSNIVEGIRYE